MTRFIALATLLLLAPAARADDRATTKDAERLVHKAVAFYQKEGRQKALAVFSDPKGPFTYRDLYIMAHDLEGTCVAHGVNKARIGKTLLHEKDADGREYMKERVERVKKEGKGWQEYKFLNPSTSKVETKVSYFELVDGVVLVCGAYKP